MNFLINLYKQNPKKFTWFSLGFAACYYLIHTVYQDYTNKRIKLIKNLKPGDTYFAIEGNIYPSHPDLKNHKYVYQK